MRRDLGTRVQRAAVQAHAGAARGAVGGDLAHVRAEVVRGVLGGDAALQRRAAHPQAVLADAQVLKSLPRSDPQLGLHEVHVRDLLGHGVLHLDARVHLDEHVLARALTGGVHEELDGPGVHVAQLLGELHGVAVQGVPDLGVQLRGRGDLDDLLVAPLQGAVALEQVHDVALVVREDLHLDVPGAQHGLLDEHRGITEGGVRLAHRRVQGAGQLLGALHTAHAAPAAAGHGLDEHGVADLLGGRDQRVLVR